ncbi:MAG: hypothetical protein OXG29_08070 [Gammaproteobacteria bacterium]|nr:hypothetical protein [Gammaproteobacteria bacterium]
MNTSFYIGSIVGGMLPVWILALLVKVTLLRKMEGRWKMPVAVAAGWIVSGALSAFGKADGGEINWALGYAITFQSAVLVLAAIPPIALVRRKVARWRKERRDAANAKKETPEEEHLYQTSPAGAVRVSRRYGRKGVRRV